MPTYSDQGLISVPKDRLWQLLRLHEDDAQISRVHPDILAQKTLSRSGNEVVVERTLKTPGGPKLSTWKLTSAPPDSYRFEIVGGEGPFTQGSFMQNRYTETAQGTQVVSHGEFTLLGVPRIGFLQKRIVRRVFDKIDMEDQKYLQSWNPG
ncbi:MAG: hypothetical protein L3K03_07660 [Thermoplasmata archaeon]|nr:hypothetical protein [Thermoplasmata archaeon]